MTVDVGALRRALEQGFASLRVVVVGDLMLDRYVWGAVRRISPEAPVPVVHIDRQTEAAGGAGNVARNLAGLGAKAALIGVVGLDPEGERVTAALAAEGVDVEGVQLVPERPTTSKVRVVGGHQQVVRLDTEDARPLDDEAAARVIEVIKQALDAQPAALILSDYAKGVLTPEVCHAAITRAWERGVPVIVDPKGADVERYQGATGMTPNRAELLALAGAAGTDGTLQQTGEAVWARCELDFLVLTLGSRGVLVFDDEGSWELPTVAREVFDVSGAGDTVIATLTVGLAAGLPLRDAVALANVAAGIVVGKIGTAPIGRFELAAAVLGAGAGVGGKIRAAADLQPLVEAWRDAGEMVVFTNGCYDLLHAGHVIGLQRAKEEGTRLVVGVNTDAGIRRLKGAGRPLVPLEHRMQVLAGLSAVDAVVAFDEDTPIHLIEALRPDVLAKGADYREDQIVGAPEVRSWGGRVARIPLIEGLSTSTMLARLRGEQDPEEGDR